MSTERTVDPFQRDDPALADTDGYESPAAALYASAYDESPDNGLNDSVDRRTAADPPSPEPETTGNAAGSFFSRFFRRGVQSHDDPHAAILLGLYNRPKAEPVAFSVAAAVASTIRVTFPDRPDIKAASDFGDALRDLLGVPAPGPELPPGISWRDGKLYIEMPKDLDQNPPNYPYLPPGEEPKRPFKPSDFIPVRND